MSFVRIADYSLLDLYCEIIAVILSLLVLGTIGAPCSDAEEYEQTEQAGEHEDHHEEDFAVHFVRVSAVRPRQAILNLMN